MIAVCVTFTVKPGTMAVFRPMMEKQARDSLEHEPDCFRFDVCFADEAQNDVFLYELYSDREAFARHLETDHFRSFDGKTADLVTSKSVRIFDEVVIGS